MCQTGGAPGEKYSAVEQKLLELIGDQNPVYNCVPGGVSNFLGEKSKEVMKLILVLLCITLFNYFAQNSVTVHSLTS